MEYKEKRYIYTKSDIVKILRNSKTSINDDIKSLKKWEKREIDTDEAITQLIYNNNMSDDVSGIDEIAFCEFARSLGYKRF